MRLLHAWTVGSVGNAGIGRAYKFFAHSVGRWPWKPLIVKSFVIPKHMFALWLFAHNKFLTRDRLGFVTDKSCALCNADVESFAHLYFRCNVSSRIWAGVREWLLMKKIMGASTAVLRAFRGTYRGNSTLNKIRCVALVATVYYVWNDRNRTIFESEKPEVEGIIKRIKILRFRCIPSDIAVVDGF
ncbi:uncharacterized protein [Primulina huaijiensis]|uniref:uncharacterized protein n=1 Tax=Primulina huaijiensis TaxID=1492673 RepID=UPI003CC76E34